jgi:hypothetical protein
MTLVLAAVLLLAADAFASDRRTAAKTPEESEADYHRAIEGRAADILILLDLHDAAKSNHVHDTVIAQYQNLRAWHDTNDSRLKALSKENTPDSKEQQEQIQGSLKQLHTNFIAGLSRDLTSDQVEKVKDKMTYGTVKVTCDAYCQMIPTLTESEKAYILELLKQGREEAMDGGSSQEKAAIFKKYKGRINNYLAAQGHDVEKDRKAWLAREKAKSKSQ